MRKKKITSISASFGNVPVGRETSQRPKDVIAAKIVDNNLIATIVWYDKAGIGWQIGIKNDGSFDNIPPFYDGVIK